MASSGARGHRRACQSPRLASVGRGEGYSAGVPTLAELLLEHPRLSVSDTEWLHLLVGDWQLLSDLSFADLVLWVRDSPAQWQAVAHVRPTTGQTVFFKDQVGRPASRPRAELLDVAYSQRRIVRDQESLQDEELPVRDEFVPVVRGRGAPIAVLTRHTSLSSMRTPSRLELTYLATSDALMRMVAGGEFPHASAPTGLRRGAPRVGDGVVRLDVDGIVTYASPNATSAIHRLGYLGELVGGSLALIVTSVLRGTAPVDEGLPLVLTGRQPWRTEVTNPGAVVSMRALPLSDSGQRYGAIVLVRDVSELRRREQELLTKEATIREIHHRVNNNLQSVAALLRLQARRTEDAKGRAALEEAERRVGAIAMVHETLSHGLDETVDFDEIVDRSIAALVDVATHGQPIRISRVGGFGRLVADDATSLAMIVTELVQNAAEHGVGGRGGQITMIVEHDLMPHAFGDTSSLITVTISDDGVGLPGGRLPVRTGLGVQIVQSLVGDLGGRITWLPGETGGTTVRFTARLRPADPS